MTRTVQRLAAAARSCRGGRASRTRYGVGAKAGQAVVVARPRGIDRFEIDPLKYEEARRDNSMMRRAEAEYAICALGMLGTADRQFRHVLDVVLAELESRRNVSSIRGQGEAAKRDHQALSSHRIRDDDANQRPPKAFRHYAKSRRVIAHEIMTLNPEGSQIESPPPVLNSSEYRLPNAIGSTRGLVSPPSHRQLIGNARRSY